MQFRIEIAADEKAIAAWLADCKGPSSLVYARGTACALAFFRGDPYWPEVKAVALACERLLAEDRVACVQRRLGEDDYEYILQRVTPALKRHPSIAA
jgi:hypothetical protein